QQVAKALEDCAEQLQTLTAKFEVDQAQRNTLARSRSVGLLKLRDEWEAQTAKIQNECSAKLALLNDERDKRCNDLLHSKDINFEHLHKSIEFRRDTLAMLSEKAQVEAFEDIPEE